MRLSLLRWPAFGALAMIAGWVFHGQSIVPLQERESKARRAAEAMKARIEEARRMVGEVSALEAQVGREQGELDAVLGDHPTDSAWVWFPERMQSHFDRRGIAGAVTRLNTAIDEKDLPGFERTYWAVELPFGNSPDEVRELCLTIVEIESIDPSIQVLDVGIRPDASDPTRCLTVVNASILARKSGASR